MLRLILKQFNTLLLKLLNRSVGFNLLYLSYRHLKVKLRWRQKVGSVDKLVECGRKRKLAIIGCGPSINELDDDFFEYLGDYDVAAFSYAALLPVHIKYYLYELPQGGLFKHHERFLYPEVERKQKVGKLEHFILKNANAKDAKQFNRFSDIKVSTTFPIHVKAIKKLRGVLDVIDFFNLASKYFFQVRSSLFSACYWADALGYEEILLVGIDLNSSEYFYERESKWLSVQIPNPFYAEQLSPGRLVVQDNLKGVKLTEAMSVLNERLQSKVYLTNPDSALAPLFQHKSVQILKAEAVGQ